MDVLHIPSHGETINGIAYVAYGLGTGRFRRMLLPIRTAEIVAEIIKERGGEAVANFADVSDYQAAEAMIKQAA